MYYYLVELFDLWWKVLQELGLEQEISLVLGKNRARAEKSDVKFANVAGIEEEKSELVELVDYLKFPAKYRLKLRQERQKVY